MENKNGIFYPSEWHPQQLVELAWPDVHTDWANMLPEVQQCYTEVVTAIAKRAKVLLLCTDVDAVKKNFPHEVLSAITFAEVDYNDTWARDFGGITVFKDNQPQILDFAFNGWGLKFAANHDNCSNRNLKANGFFGETPLLNCKNVVLEGGSIESDGNGTLLTTSVCLLSDNRNDEWGKPELENLLKERLGVSKILWLDYGHLQGDDTDGHVDTLARLAPNNSIVYCQSTNPDDVHFEALQRMEDQLKSFTNINGEEFELFPIPLPSPVFDGDDRLPATYVNYLILNGAVLVPVYGVPEDEQALEVIAKAHPGYEIVGINCVALVKQHGSLHCITMNYPEGTFKNKYV